MPSRFLLLFLVPLAAIAATSPFSDFFFEPNLGQTKHDVRYLARLPGASLAVVDDGLILQPSGDHSEAIHVRFKSERPRSRFEPLDELPNRTSYFLGSDLSAWVRDVPHYQRLAWRGVYPGVDVVFYGHEGCLEYDFILAPRVDPKIVKLEFDRTVHLSLQPTGDLEIGEGPGALVLRRPNIYQVSGAGVKTPVAGRYRLTSRGEVSLKLEHYDRGLPLIVEPVLVSSTYYGGERDDSVVAVTSTGDIVGVTNSLAFGTGTQRRGKDIFVRFYASGSPFGGLVTYFFGGSDDDVATCAIGNSSTI